MIASFRAAAASFTAAAALLSLVLAFAVSHPTVAASGQTAPRTAEGAATEAEARVVCGACHLFPSPEILPRSAWRDEVARMTLIRENQPEPTGPTGTAARMVTLPPDMQRVLRYYIAAAPEHLPAPTPWPDADSSRFTVRTFSPPDPPPGPAISHVRVLDLDADGKPDLVASEMRYGMLVRGRLSDPRGRLDMIASTPHPAQFAVVDFDKDGVDDLLVGDLGRFL